MATTEGVNSTQSERTTEELRAQMFRILDELASARSDRASALKAEFEALWKNLLQSEEPTLH